MRTEGPSEQSLRMQSTAPHQALHSDPHDFTYTLPDISKMSLRDLGSSCFSGIYAISLRRSPLHPPPLSLFYLNALRLHSWFHLVQCPLSLPREQHAFSDQPKKKTGCAHKWNIQQYETGMDETNTSRTCNVTPDMSSLLFANLNTVYLLSLKNVGWKWKSKHRDKNVF